MHTLMAKAIQMQNALKVGRYLLNTAFVQIMTKMRTESHVRISLLKNQKQEPITKIASYVYKRLYSIIAMVT